MIVYGSELSKKIREELKEEVSGFREKPCLAVILVGEDPASVSYVRSKNKACIETGMDCRQIDLPADISKEDLIALIHDLNKDDSVDGILVQLPLPKHLNKREIIGEILPEKDVDGLHPVNVGKLELGLEGFVPCTPQGIMELLGQMDVELKGKNAVVVGRSTLVGIPVAKLLLDKDCTVTICHSKTENLKEITKRADILVAAIGKAHFFTEDYIKEGAYVLDVGVSRVNGKLMGDVDFENVKDKCAAITPVPKGVGPMTVTMLLKNTVLACKRRRG